MVVDIQKRGRRKFKEKLPGELSQHDSLSISDEMNE